MGGHNRTCRSLRWEGMPGEQICVRGLRIEVLRTSNFGTLSFFARHNRRLSCQP